MMPRRDGKIAGKIEVLVRSRIEELAMTIAEK